MSNIVSAALKETEMTDDALIEAMARAMFGPDQINRLDIAKAALAVARPIIAAQEQERCARIAESRYWEATVSSDRTTKAIAAALKETDNA